MSIQTRCLRYPDPVLPPASLIGDRPPQMLYVRGHEHAFELLSRLPEFGFAVVGTRRPQARSLELTRSRIRALAGTRLIILSGLALGTDATAHESALSGHLPTIAVLGGPLDPIYPRQNQELAERIVAQGGLLVSEHAPGTKIEPHFFLMRNRLIAGWAQATWIVEASFRSGALNTAYWSRDQNRDTYATPCFPGDPTYAGTQKLIEDDKAHAFWQPKDLGHTWKELVNLGHPSRIHPMPPLWTPAYNDRTPASDTELLTREVRRATVRRGGASVEWLLDWAVSTQWDPQRFFAALESCLSERRIEDQGGVLYASDPAGC